MPNGNDVRFTPEQWCLVQTLLLEGALKRHHSGRERTARKVIEELIPPISLVAGSDVLDAATREVRESFDI